MRKKTWMFLHSTVFEVFCGVTVGILVIAVVVLFYLIAAADFRSF